MTEVKEEIVEKMGQKEQKVNLVIKGTKENLVIREVEDSQVM